MIRTNLSTRPFYNTRAVLALLGVLAILALAMTSYNVVQLVRLTNSQRTLGAKAVASESEANTIIDQRTFSWTDVFSHFEATLPADVRITSVQQQAGRPVVLISAESRTIEDLDKFIEALEKTGAFHDVRPGNETVMENDIIAATLEATYTPPARKETKP